MKAMFVPSSDTPIRANLASALGLFGAVFAAGSVSAEPGTPEQKRACTPDVYRLCPGEIANVRAITACLRRQKASLARPAMPPKAS
jgi:hypothetical protein